ncbi:hypothetical protein CTAYLR_004303 [Chrysophaeum taylorii]|uniref:UTP-monosaccharide-1-phosphate uridylyltransferase n=1 Tax=Chrysophaeum taylorii TaxID=2483200 RepID=A0AAD7XQA2_9STRA|nr:hypothetical protein CTAYLR_004303 [Chrysophaeum taylorii]
MKGNKVARLVLLAQAGFALLWRGAATGGDRRMPTLGVASVESVMEAGNLALLDDEERSVAEVLVALGQEHVLAGWPGAGEEDEGKKRLMRGLVKADKAYVGGLEKYVEKARKLLAESARGDNAFEGLTPSVPEGEVLAYDDNLGAAEEVGFAAAKGLGFVLVAGGLGERLGYEGIKLELPVEGATGVSFIQLYLDYISALSKRVGRELPLAIMTSDDTDEATRKLAGDLPNVEIIKQDKVPALVDASARFAVKGWELSTKPHGHGDVHALLRRSGIARRWLDGRGVTHLFFFQDTNPLVLNTVIASLGVSVSRGFSMNSICIPRRAGEAAGGIARLSSGNGADLVINVEYNQLDPLLQSAGGDLNDESGYSPYPGNANILVLRLDDYVKTIEGPDEGVVDEFVNPKYADENKTKFKKPTRLECMMQDFPKLLTRMVPEALVGFTSFERWVAFSPAKNNLESARDMARKGEPAGSAASAEFDVYRAHARKARQTDEGTRVLGGVENLYGGPRVVLKPSFSIVREDVLSKIRRLEMDKDSTLVVDGANIHIKNLVLKNKAALYLTNTRDDATLVVDGLVLDRDGGLDFDDIPDSEIPKAKPSDRIRGYATTLSPDALKIHVDAPGNFILGADGALKPTTGLGDDDEL